MVADATAADAAAADAAASAVASAADSAAPAASAVPYVLVADDDALDAWEAALPPPPAPLVLGVDTETTGLDPLKDRIRFLQVAASAPAGHPVLVLDLQAYAGDRAALPARLGRLLARGTLRVLQNAKFDRKFLAAAGVPLPQPVFDTLLAAQVLRTASGPARLALDELARYFLGQAVSKKEQASDWSGPISASQLAYAARDAQVLLPLHGVLAARLDKEGLARCADLEFACMDAVADMELGGIRLDLAQWEALRADTTRARDAALDRVYAVTGRPLVQTSLFGDPVAYGPDLESRRHLLSLLHRHGVPVDDTSRHALLPYADRPLVAAVLDWRKAQKSLTAFLRAMPSAVHPADGRVHAQYQQIGASSGRMSCFAPNIQQIPRDPAFRRCFVPDPGNVLLVADYAQVELRVAAEVADDARMTAAFAAGEDLHRLTAALVSGKPADAVTKAERQAAKAVNFGLLYAMGARGLAVYAAEQYGVDLSLEEAERFRARFFDAYRGIAAWQRVLRDRPAAEARTLAGRRIPLPPDAPLSMRCNLPVQGTAADIVKIALGALSRALAGTGVRIVAAVHDEILLEAPEADAAPVADLLKRVMEDAERRLLRKVPALAEVAVARSWADKA